MDRGYFALYRKIMEHPFYKEKRVFSKYEAWVDLLLNAQHSEKDQQVVIGNEVMICNYGESLKSKRTWARRWGWAESKVRRFFTLLEKMNQIRQKSEGKTTRTTILNYSKYDLKRRNDDAKVTQPRRKPDANLVTDNNGKNEECEESLKDSSYSIEQETEKIVPKKKKGINYTEDFELFWKAYPNKKKKGLAFKSFNKILEPVPTTDELIESVRLSSGTNSWNDPKYIPHPATWLNARGWEDEVTEADKPKKQFMNGAF